MRICRLEKDGCVVLERVELALGLRERMRGLLGRAGLDAAEGILISPCNSIHTFGMRFSIDLFFLDRHQRVVRVVRGVAPGRLAAGGIKAHSVIETAAGAVPGDRVAEGDALVLVSADADDRLGSG